MSSPISGTAPAPTSWRPGSGASSSSSPEAPRAPARVGRDGLLRLAFERRGARTVLTERRFTLPLQALEPLDLDAGRVATLVLLNPTGGLLGGDVLETSVRLGAGSRVCLTTPSATRVYRCPGAPAVQRLVADVGPGAALEWLPDHVIPSPGARLRQAAEIALGPGAALLFLDAWASGRAARREAWSFDFLDSGLEVRDAGGLVLKERCVLDAVRAGQGLGGTEGFPYIATFAALAPHLAGWEALVRELQAELDAVAPDARAGVMPLARGGLLARVLCPSAPRLGACVLAMWARCRRRVLGLEPAALRKL